MAHASDRRGSVIIPYPSPQAPSPFPTVDSNDPLTRCQMKKVWFSLLAAVVLWSVTLADAQTGDKKTDKKEEKKKEPKKRPPAFTDEKDAGPDFQVQGEYKAEKLGAHLVA